MLPLAIYDCDRSTFASSTTLHAAPCSSRLSFFFFLDILEGGHVIHSHGNRGLVANLGPVSGRLLIVQWNYNDRTRRGWTRGVNFKLSSVRFMYANDQIRIEWKFAVLTSWFKLIDLDFCLAIQVLEQMILSFFSHVSLLDETCRWS